MIELGASTLGFRHVPLEVALNEIQSQGFRSVDLCAYPSYCPHFNPAGTSEADIQQLKDSLGTRGLHIAAINAGFGDFGSPDSHEQAMAYTRASIDLAARLGAYTVTTQSGIEPVPTEWLAVARSIVPDLRALGDYASDRGLELTLELHKTKLMANSEQSLLLMELVDHPNVGVALDPSHITYAGEKADQVALKLGKHIKHVHLRDGVGKNIMVVPGDGTVDFASLARALEQIGYARVAVIELEYEHALADEVRPDLARAKALLGRFFQAA